jgi:hypothetical protein
MKRLSHSHPRQTTATNQDANTTEMMMEEKKVIINSNSTNMPLRTKKTLKDVYYDEKSRAMRYSKKESVVPSITTVTEEDDELLDLDEEEEEIILNDNDSTMNHPHFDDAVRLSLKTHHRHFRLTSTDDTTSYRYEKAQHQQQQNRSVDHSVPWNQVYVPKPVIDSSTILIIGCSFYVIAQLWTPLLLIITIFVSWMVPYWVRENDMASSRRQLFQQFLQYHTTIPSTTATFTNLTIEPKGNKNEKANTNFTVPKEFQHLRSSLSSIRLEQSYWTNSRYVPSLAASYQFWTMFLLFRTLTECIFDFFNPYSLIEH